VTIDDLFGRTVPLGETAMIARLGLAMLLGAGFGLDRELREMPAGLRTNILVSIAAAAFAIAAIEAVHLAPFRHDNVQLDSLRVIEAVTAGVAFLAAGTIIQGRRGIRGVTSGASLWLCGAVGLASGLGLWRLAVTATAMGLFVLIVLGALQRGWTKPRASGADAASSPAKTGATSSRAACRR
jgi:putative Mg2+ transporter-C (MgtC) family protein